jgi:hypothetical protein
VSHNWSGEQLTSRSRGSFQGVYGTWHVQHRRLKAFPVRLTSGSPQQFTVYSKR